MRDLLARETGRGRRRRERVVLEETAFLYSNAAPGIMYSNEYHVVRGERFAVLWTRRSAVLFVKDDPKGREPPTVLAQPPDLVSGQEEWVNAALVRNTGADEAVAMVRNSRIGFSVDVLTLRRKTNEVVERREYLFPGGGGVSETEPFEAFVSVGGALHFVFLSDPVVTQYTTTDESPFPSLVRSLPTDGAPLRVTDAGPDSRGVSRFVVCTTRNRRLISSPVYEPVDMSVVSSSEDDDDEYADLEEEEEEEVEPPSPPSPPSQPFLGEEIPGEVTVHDLVTGERLLSLPFPRLEGSFDLEEFEHTAYVAVVSGGCFDWPTPRVPFLVVTSPRTGECRLTVLKLFGREPPPFTEKELRELEGLVGAYPRAAFRDFETLIRVRHEHRKVLNARLVVEASLDDDGRTRVTVTEPAVRI